MRIEIPAQVEWILKELRDHGYEAFAVGGCVRDTLLGRVPGDWDITTSAKPEEVKAVFGHTIDTGLQHGTVTVMRDHVGYEITTYRIDGEYEDGRHPKEVEFTSDLKEDLQRRDFTINAMAYSHETGIVDVFGGMEDLERRVIRCVGTATERFTEDALRILRAIRFSAQLNFAIEKETWDALSEIAPNLAHVSKERIQVELTKTLLSAHPEHIRMTKETGMVPYISKSFALAFAEDPAAGAPVRLYRASALPKDKAVRWAAFLAEAGEKALVQILKELKMDNDTISRGKVLVRWYREPLPIRHQQGQKKPAERNSEGQKEAWAEQTDIWLRRAMSTMEDDLFDLLLTFWEVLRPEEAETVGWLRERVQIIRGRGDCIRLKQLAVTGNDLMAAGVPKGPGLGKALNGLFEKVLEQPELNKKENLLKEV